MWLEHCEPYAASIQPNALIVIVGPLHPLIRPKPIPLELFTGNEVGIDLSSPAKITRKSGIRRGPALLTGKRIKAS
jgi:hypothetical protein